MAHFDLDDYITVNDRIQSFWQGDLPTSVYDENRQIHTEIVQLDDATVKNRMVVIKASVFVKGVLVATGFAKEREGLAGANKTAFIENCETSAIGRALANMGLLVSKNRASREEMAAVEAITDENEATLADIKAFGMTVGTEEIKQLVNTHWKDCVDNPVRAKAFLLELREKYASYTHDEEVAEVL
jgi:hypothetical protein